MGSVSLQHESLRMLLREAPETAVTLALGLIGALALWMGLLKIAEESGMLLQPGHPLDIRNQWPRFPRQRSRLRGKHE